MRVVRFRTAPNTLEQAVQEFTQRAGISDEQVLSVQLLPMRDRNGIPLFEVVLFLKDLGLTRDQVLKAKYRA